MAAAVLGHVGDAQRDGPRGGADPRRTPPQEDLAGVGRRQAEEHPRQLGPPRADEPGQAEDLAGPDGQVDPAHARRPAAQAADLQHHLAGRHGPLGEDRRELAADHHPDQLGAGHLGHPPGADERPVAQRGHAVGDLRQLLEAVRDVDDPDPLRLQLADDAEEVLHLLVAERGGGLVHDQDPGVGPQRPGDLDELLLGHRQPAHLGLGVDARADPPEEPPGPLPAPCPADPTPGPPRLQPQRDVLGDRQVGEEGRLLVDRGDPERAGADRVVVLDRPALHLERSLVRRVGAGDDLDQRRLPRAVLADQGMDLAGLQVEGDAPQRLDPGERLADARQPEECRHRPPPEDRLDRTSRSYARTSASQSGPTGTSRARQW